MWYTTRHEGFDTKNHSLREPKIEFLRNFSETFYSSWLRLSTGFRVLGYSIFTGVSIYFGFFFSWELNDYPVEVVANEKFQILLSVAQSFLLVATLYGECYQACLSDDAGWARGFRGGSKLISVAVTIDCISQTLQLASYSNLYLKFDRYWFDTDYSVAGFVWSTNHGARVLHGMALVIYGFGYCLLELFHDIGTDSYMGFIILINSALSGIFEAVFFVPRRIVFFYQFIVSIIIFVWACKFEVESTAVAPMNETELVNIADKEVDQFAHMNPYDE